MLIHHAARAGARLALHASLSVAALHLTPPARCAAQDAASSALEDPADRAVEGSPAQQAFAAAVEEYDAGHYPEALALLRQAHALEPTARTLRAIGMAAFGMRRYVVAVQALRDALASTTRPLSDDQRAHAQALLERATRFVVDVRASVDPPDASLRIDGERLPPDASGAVLLEVGRHTFTASHPEREPLALEVELEPGASREVVLQLPLRPRVATPTPSTEPAQSARDPLLAAGSALGIVATLAVAAAITTGVLALSDRDILAAGCDPFFCPDPLRPVRDRALSLSQATDGLGWVAAGLGVASVTLLLLGATSAEPGAPRAALVCSSGGCVGSVAGVF